MTTSHRERRVILVSNRLPFSLRKTKLGWRTERSAGGLVHAMKPVLERSGGLWLGWPGDGGPHDDARRREVLARWSERHAAVPVELPQNVGDLFYNGYANQTLWPLFHQFVSHLCFDPAGWHAYVEANQRFRDVVLEHARPDDLIWIHDYHLMLLPSLLREAAPDARIGFFLHIPFPPSAMFRVLPRKEKLLAGLLGADLLGFQTYGHLQHFRSALLRILGLESRMDRVEHDDRTISLEASPIGVDAGEFLALLDRDPQTARHLESLAARFAGKRVLLAVDRLDYTKGIPERFRTFRRLLDSSPGLRGRAVLVQVAVPSREKIPHYDALRRELNELVGSINGDLGTADWTPVVYIHRAIPRAELAALYAIADIGWVTPLRDGMNLVAKEYVVCQRGREGVLVMSEFAGAASEMAEALLVNPFDEVETAAALERALALPAAERRRRMAALHARVARNSVFAWSERFLARLSESSAAARPPRGAAPFTEVALLSAFVRARDRLIFLDYDGTLVDYRGLPEDAVAPPSLLETLARIAADPANCTAIVSGRSRASLESLFGGVDGLWLFAEHGAAVRPPTTRRWEKIHGDAPSGWRERVRPVLEHFVDRTPGSFVEEKEYALVWHFRLADPEFAGWLANELVANLDALLAETELRAVRGDRTVEVKPSWANKREAVSWMAAVRPRPEFVMAVGDDRADEDLFAHLPSDAWTIRVGQGRTRARHRLPGPESARRLLETLSRASAASRPPDGAVPGDEPGTSPPEPAAGRRC
jgi:trehalose 6-phosphate synthase/phosphatase